MFSGRYCLIVTKLRVPWQIFVKNPRYQIIRKSVQRKPRRCTRTDVKLQCPFRWRLKIRRYVTDAALRSNFFFVFCFSPKSPPNSPNTELSTDDDLKGVYINYCYKVSEGFLVVFSANDGLTFYPFAYMKWMYGMPYNLLVFWWHWFIHYISFIVDVLMYVLTRKAYEKTSLFA